jgi:hypothetical protein
MTKHEAPCARRLAPGVKHNLEYRNDLTDCIPLGAAFRAGPGA